LPLLDLEPVDERHRADAQRGSRGQVERALTAESIEDVERPFDRLHRVARQPFRAHSPLRQHIALVDDDLAAPRKAEPELEILTSPQRLVEEPRGHDRPPPGHDGRQHDVAALLNQADERDLALRWRPLHEALAGEGAVAADPRVAIDERATAVRLDQGHLT